MKILLVFLYLVVAATAARRQWITSTPTTVGWLVSTNPGWYVNNGYMHLTTLMNGNLCVRYGNGIIIESRQDAWCARRIPGFPNIVIPRAYVTFLQTDGNLCIYPGSSPTSFEPNPVWCSSWTATQYSAPATGYYFLTLQSDGNLCTYKGTGPSDNQGVVWCSMGLPGLSKFSMVITSDPQIARAGPGTYPDPDPRYIPRPWGDQESTDEWGSELWWYSYKKVTWQYDSIKALARSGAVPNVRGVMVNGDITEHGHYDQWYASNERLDYLGQSLRWWPGLGNHDVVDDCAGDNCRARMFKWMYDKIDGYKSQNLLTRSDVSKRPLGLWQNLYIGTFGYSFDEGPLHVIQLQNHPEYSADFTAESGFGDKFIVPTIVSWLASDLAANKDKIIIINMHGVDGNYSRSRFESVVYQYRSSIAAIFTGHLHDECGFRYYTGSVPTFRSGAACYGDYLNAEFDFPSLTMTVKRILNDNCGNYKVTDSRTICKMGDTKIDGIPACTVFTNANTTAEQNSWRETLNFNSQGCFAN